MFFVIFGIVGVNYFKGAFSFCAFNIDYLEVKTKWDCLNTGGIWKKHDVHFDDIFTACLNLFEMATTEGWIPAMWTGLDSVGIDREPI